VNGLRGTRPLPEVARRVSCFLTKKLVQVIHSLLPLLPPVKSNFRMLVRAVPATELYRELCRKLYRNGRDSIKFAAKVTKRGLLGQALG
jgi:hypothetical protein